MGVATTIFGMLFGGGSNKVKDIVEVFRPNAEAQSQRQNTVTQATLGQYAAEFQYRENRTWWDSFVDGLNRLVRPLMALSVLSIFPATAIWPAETAVVFASWALIPTAFWVLISTIVAFYFDGRKQIKAQDFERSIAEAAARAPQVIENIQRLRDHLTPMTAADDSAEAGLQIAGDAVVNSKNPAILDWFRSAKE